MTACGGSPSASGGRDRDATTSGAPTTTPKTITIAQLNPIKSYGPWEFSTTAGGGASLAEVHTIGLVSEDQDGKLEPRLVTRLPSIDDGTIKVLADGRMETIWSLRSG